MDMQHREHSKHNEYTYGWIFIQEIYLITWLHLYVRQTIKFLMTRLSVCSIGVSCNEMIDTPMLLVVTSHNMYILHGDDVLN